jgi:hypothetical protein
VNGIRASHLRHNRDGDSRHVEARHIGFHGALVEDERAAVAAKLDTRPAEQFVVLQAKEGTSHASHKMFM